ncbi:MFS transporter [Vogesella alkaliphila]|uniref:MFS-type transporter n=1 Tax=Vogesella alkaliphila TaxID=1193621 RepID=A0ABQ2YDH3_9NEIS|nr:MFS transporter [Vogesella alkaliphila]GGX78614.1 putative MFS-type transporter [Vogesella alkaliphila]
MAALKASLHGWRELSPAARLLVANGLAFNLGFYMMMPYLAQHLGGTLGLAGWAAGLVMGMRVFSQQGLFLLGGTLGDRIGYRPAIVWGCLIRSLGFALLGWADRLPLLLLAAFLTGFAGALFTPCAQAYLAAECRSADQRQQAFALHNLASEAGMLLGPLAGMLLTRLDYAVTGVVSGGVFLLLTWLQWRMLPPQPVPARPAPAAASVTAQWRTIVRNRPFLRFALCASAYSLLFHQLYLAVPAFIQSQHHATGLLGSVFTVTALIGVTLQLPATQLVQRRLGVARAMGLGLGLMGCSYLAIPWLAAWPVPATLLLACGLSLGSILCYPLFSAHLPHYATPGQLGSYYGFYASLGGVVALLGNVLIGSLLGAAGRTPPVVIWYALAACGAVAGWQLYRQLARAPAHPDGEGGR